MCRLKTKAINMKITKDNGYLIYSVDSNEVTIDSVKVHQQRQGTGRELIAEVKTIASSMGLQIGLYAEPQDETISDNELRSFYKSCGFDLDENDVDGKLFVWKN